MYTNEAKRFKACAEIEHVFEEIYKDYYMCLNCFQPYNVKKHAAARKTRGSLNESLHNENLMKFDEDVVEHQEEDLVVRLQRENEALKERIRQLESKSESQQALPGVGEENN